MQTLVAPKAQDVNWKSQIHACHISETVDRQSGKSSPNDDDEFDDDGGDSESVLLRPSEQALASGAPTVEHPGLCFMRPGNIPMLLTLDESTLKYILQTLRTFPSSFAQEDKALYIHPKLIREMPVSRAAAKIFSICKNATRLRSSADRAVITQELELRVQELLNYAYKNKPDIQGLLTSVQALILAQITLSFGPLSKGPINLKALSKRTRDLRAVGLWSYKLWSSAPWVLPNASSPEQAWLFAESVRRTLIVAHLVTDTFAVLMTGTFKFTGFVSALPYDSRTELWENPEGPLTGVESDLLSTGKSTLLSFRQLVNRFEDGVLTSKDVGHFERMLLVACRGYRMVMNRLGACAGNGQWSD